MISIALLISTVVSSIGWLSNKAASMALVKYMKDKGYTSPSDEEVKAYCTSVLKELFRIR